MSTPVQERRPSPQEVAEPTAGEGAPPPLAEQVFVDRTGRRGRVVRLLASAVQFGVVGAALGVIGVLALSALGSGSGLERASSFEPRGPATQAPPAEALSPPERPPARSNPSFPAAVAAPTPAAGVSVPSTAAPAPTAAAPPASSAAERPAVENPSPPPPPPAPRVSEELGGPDPPPPGSP